MKNARRLLLGCWLVGALFAAAGVAHAAITDYEAGFYWYPNGQPAQQFYNALAAVQFVADQQITTRNSYCTSASKPLPSFNSNVSVDAVYDMYNAHGRWDWGCGDGVIINDSGVSIHRTTCTIGVNCPLPPVDDCEQGKWHLVEGRAASLDALYPDSMCIGTCKVTAGTSTFAINEECTAPGVCTWWQAGTVEQTGEQCVAAPGEPTPEPAPNPTPEDPGDGNPYGENENCVLSENGTEICQNWDPQRADKNCGYVNDVFRCLDSAQPDKCFVNADGSRLCAEGAKPPTVPDNGTPGVPATPDDKIGTSKAGEGTTNTYNYYNSSTVGGSSRPVTPDGSNPARPGSGGPGEDGGEEGGGGEASGGETCATAPVCDGDPIQCAVLEQQWRTRCAENPTDAELETAFGPVEGESGEPFGLGTEERDVGSLTEYATGWMGAETCISDYTINMGSLLGSYDVPLSELCWFLEMIGIFVMIAAYVQGARIVAGGF